jgi:hypothetical protein
MFRRTILLIALIALMALVGNTGWAQNPYRETLGSNVGFTGATSFTIGSSSATILPALPSGCHEAWLWSETPFNYGDATVSTNTYELWWGPSTEVEASGTAILYRSQPLVLDKFVTPNPTVYFRTRVATVTQTIYVRYR